MWCRESSQCAIDSDDARRGTKPWCDEVECHCGLRQDARDGRELGGVEVVVRGLHGEPIIMSQGCGTVARRERTQ
ncbi:MAG: hypothetical protein EBT17_03665 [Actinobacteria bacterium]|nr:hypothetical protein [Actinomycetota bacterium]NDC46724.1 hypothetical protein [Actinomycetota bacterium]NDE67327.1 hypothetical protein [Actinomycetota bacterium]